MSDEINYLSDKVRRKERDEAVIKIIADESPLSTKKFSKAEVQAAADELGINRSQYAKPPTKRQLIQDIYRHEINDYLTPGQKDWILENGTAKHPN